MKHKYTYRCDKCDNIETLEQERGSPRQHTCTQDGCDGTCKRVPSTKQEVVFDTYTPGVASQNHKENRSANEVMTKLRVEAGQKPIRDPDHMAVERHMGRKNRIV